MPFPEFGATVLPDDVRGATRSTGAARTASHPRFWAVACTCPGRSLRASDRYSARRRRPVTILLLALLLLAGLFRLADAAEPGYRLQPGDIVAISVTGIPELSQRAPVQIGGWITYSLLGRFDAAGLDASELQDRMRSALAARPYRKLLADGQMASLSISPEALTVDIAAYRPVYVEGDVVKPGEFAFRTGVSVRQAITLAGGYDVLRGRRLTDTDRFLQAAELRGDVERLAVTLASIRARADRIRTLLGKHDRAAATPESDSQPSGVTHEIHEASTRLLALQEDQAKTEETHFDTALRLIDSQLSILRSREDQEGKGMAADEVDYERMRSLRRDGTVPALRVADARRAWQYSAAQSLQTASKIAEVEREREVVALDRERLRTQRQQSLEEQLAQAVADQAVTEARLSAAYDKLGYLSGRPEGVGRNGDVAAAILRIHRRSGETTAVLPATGDMELMPGDVLEVKLGTAIGTAGSEPMMSSK